MRSGSSTPHPGYPSHTEAVTRHPPVVSRIGRRTFIVPQGEPGVRPSHRGTS